MKHIPTFIASLIGGLITLALGFAWVKIILALAIGALAGWVSTRLPKGSERVYWLGVGITFLLYIISIGGANLSSFLVIAPIIFMLCYFLARLVGRFTGAREVLPS